MVFPTAYRSKIYLAPAEKSPEGKVELWVNFGYPWRRGHSFPEYHQALAGLCTEQQYQAVTAALGQVLDEGPTPCAFGASWLLGCCTLGLLLCPMADLSSRCGANYLRMVDVLDSHAADWRGPARLQFVLSAEAVGPNREEQGVDQHGNPCAKDRQHAVPVWPPLGGNLVFTLDETQLRDPWPQVTLAPPLPTTMAMSPVPLLAEQLQQLEPSAQCDAAAGGKCR